MYVTAKVDGSNGCVFWDEALGEVRAGSRNFVLSDEEDNAYFHEWLKGDAEEARLLRSYCERNRKRVVYGEWMGRDKFVGAFKAYDKEAKGEEKTYSRTDRVSAKTYLYAMRAVLAARWALEMGTPAPMEFRELVGAVLDAEMVSTVDRLLEVKSDGTEKCEVTRMRDLEKWIAEEAEALFDRTREAKAPEKKEWVELDELFLRLVRE